MPLSDRRDATICSVHSATLFSSASLLAASFSSSLFTRSIPVARNADEVRGAGGAGGAAGTRGPGGTGDVGKARGTEGAGDGETTAAPPGLLAAVGTVSMVSQCVR